MPPLTDRTAIETDWTCARKRWWQRHAHGQGIVPAMTPAALATGIAMHEMFANVMDPLGSLTQSAVLPEDTPPEVPIWLDASTHALARYIKPRWFDDYYDIIAVEHEVGLERHGVAIAVTVDLITRNKRTGKLRLWDWKSVTNPSMDWSNAWAYQLQPHLYTAAIEDEMQESVEAFHMVGVKKPNQREGKLRHPYTWVYYNTKTEEIRPYARGETWQLVLISDLMPITEWVEQQGEGTACEQFICSEPIVQDVVWVDEVIRQAARRELEIADALAREEGFEWWEARWNHCRPTHGFACEYLDACWNQSVGDHPIECGLYVQRDPHHALERLW